MEKLTLTATQQDRFQLEIGNIWQSMKFGILMLKQTNMSYSTKKGLKAGMFLNTKG